MPNALCTACCQACGFPICSDQTHCTKILTRRSPTLERLIAQAEITSPSKTSGCRISEFSKTNGDSTCSHPTTASYGVASKLESQFAACSSESIMLAGWGNVARWTQLRLDTPGRSAQFRMHHVIQLATIVLRASNSANRQGRHLRRSCHLITRASSGQ